MLTRRKLGTSALLAALGFAARAETQTGESANVHEHGHDMSNMPASWHGDEQIVFLGYQGMTALDLIGPQYMLANLMGATVKVAAKSLDPIMTDTGITLVPDVTFEDAVKDPDVLCIPGGTLGTLDAMRDGATMEFVRQSGANAGYVTSVCTGTLLLGQAGLIDGYRVTSHWITRPMMEQFGAIPVNERVVVDRNRITGAGVTAGIDFGLMLLARMRDDDYAKGVQLLAEYDPQPPFDAGTPEKAPAHLTELLEGMFAVLGASVSESAAYR